MQQHETKKSSPKGWDFIEFIKMLSALTGKKYFRIN